MEFFENNFEVVAGIIIAMAYFIPVVFKKIFYGNEYSEGDGARGDETANRRSDFPGKRSVGREFVFDGCVNKPAEEDSAPDNRGEIELYKIGEEAPDSEFFVEDKAFSGGESDEYAEVEKKLVSLLAEQNKIGVSKKCDVPANPEASTRFGLNSRGDLARAFVLSEILSKPMAMRRDIREI